MRSSEGAAGQDPTISTPVAARLTMALFCALALLQSLAFASGGRREQRIIGHSIAAGTLIVAAGRSLDTLRRRVGSRIARGTHTRLLELYSRLRVRRVVWAPMARQLPEPDSMEEKRDDDPAETVTPTPPLKMIGFLGAAAFANMIAHVIVAPQGNPTRLLQVAVLYGYTSLGLAVAVSYVFRRRAVSLLVSATCGACAMVAMEFGLERLTRGAGVDGSIRWVGGAVPHSILEDHYPPNSEGVTIFPENPRGYFKKRDPSSGIWTLGISHSGGAARLVLADTPGADAVRVEVERADVPEPWHIQLSHKGLTLKKGRTYLLAFGARASRPRTASYIQAQSRPRWQTLGEYREIAVDTDWREYLDAFSSTGTSDEAQVTFNLGGGTGAFEVRGVEVRDIATDASVIRERPSDYEVRYRFNDQGCRGPSYATSRSAGQRILVLGDSFALGVGVHEEDTFAVRLESLLNGQMTNVSTRARSEVINCSIAGHATRQERQLFEILGPLYAPDVVIVAMTSDDDLSSLSAVRQGFVHRPSRYEGLFLTWGLIQYALHEGRRPPPDFSDSLQELHLLRDLCARMNARLVVVAFRNAPLTGSWRTLTETIPAGLSVADTPWLDIGEGLGSKHDWKDLVIWPGVDVRPNELAHLSAAEQIARLLAARGLLR